MDRTPNADKPLKDHGSFSRSKLSEDDINGNVTHAKSSFSTLVEHIDVKDVDPKNKNR